MSNEAFLILGNQLFPLELLPFKGKKVFMAEDFSLCTHFAYHKHKLILFLAAMREYGDELRRHGFEPYYHFLREESVSQSYEEKLVDFLFKQKIKVLHCFEIEDKFFESRISLCLKDSGITLVTHPTPMFLFSREDFRDYNRSVRTPFMKTYYEERRRKTSYLMAEGKPHGGKFSFDSENRKKLPKGKTCPTVTFPKTTRHVREVSLLVDSLFSSHPGESSNFWLPVTRDAALKWFHLFLEQRFQDFGPYEDALSGKEPFLFHSVLSPMLNLGLLTPKEVIVSAIESAQKNDIPLNSLEGFVRQILGWREFVRGIYREYSETQETRNFFGHSRKLTSRWYTGELVLPPLQDAVKKAIRFGYNHHIERLMIISNTMLLLEVDPKEVYRWFMEMYVDSSDWVMGPNVFGMGQFSDGGIFATKPYTCGSNYIRKMSDYIKGDWCDALDGLYWQFIEKHSDFYLSSPRMGQMVYLLEKIGTERKKTIYSAAQKFQKAVTEP
ncbi:MAG: cryptochrome/photolyase family protein [Bdellovibrionales bacterium]|nr:cryptochrome/photolyase family protein [Bdellovibrionales bacterium]